MKKTKKFIINNATITIDNATTLQINNNKGYKIDAPFIFAMAYKCKNYVLLHELQGYSTDKVIKPKTNQEFVEGLLSMDNPYYIDFYHMLHDKIYINTDGDDFIIVPNDSYDGEITPYMDESLNYFHLFKVSANIWMEIDSDFESMNRKSLIEWTYFAGGMLNQPYETAQLEPSTTSVR